MSWFSDTKNWLSEKASSAMDSVSEIAGDIKDAAVSTARVYAAGAQGLVMGLGGGVASIADFAVNTVVNVGYDWTTRHAINAFRDENNQLGSVSVDMSGALVNGIRKHGLQPQTEAEKWAMASGQAVGEVAVIVGATIATAGVGGAVAGAALTTARATSIGSKIANVSSSITNAAASATVNASKFGATAQSATATVMQAGNASMNAGNALINVGSNAPLITRIFSGANGGSRFGWGIANPLQLNGRLNQAATVAEVGFLGFATYKIHDALTQEEDLLAKLNEINDSNYSINPDNLHSVRELDDYLAKEWPALSGSDLVGDEYQAQYEKLSRISDIATKLGDNELYGNLTEQDVNDLVGKLKQDGINLDLRTASERQQVQVSTPTTVTRNDLAFVQ